MKRFAALIAFFLLAYVASAQSAERISQIISTKEITYGQCAWLACVSSQLIEDDADYDKALPIALEKGWIDSGAIVDKPIKLQKLCGLFVRSSGMKCGLFYRLTKSDRYAYKELKANGTLDFNADPAMNVSGQNAVNVLNGCLKKAGGKK
ncbi:MAG: hypothetical protein K6A42_00045 [Treponema sp.]|nr:hypothetical protein [Treponema sp.]